MKSPGRQTIAFIDPFISSGLVSRSITHSIENVTLQNNLDPGESYLVLKGIINNLEGTVEGGRSNSIAVLSSGVQQNCSSKRTHLCKIKT